MDQEASISYPITIKIDNNGEVFILNESDNTEIKIPNGVMLGTEHYGFIIMSEFKGVQREVVYPTKNKVDAIGVDNNSISVYEYGIRDSWVFDKKGTLIRTLPDSPITFDYDMTEKALDNSKQLLGEHRLSDPITLVIGENSTIMFNNNDEYPINPGVMIGGEHYGFILIREVRGRQIERVFPTQNRIQAIGVTSKEIGTDFDIFEEGKHFPWKFDKTGKLLKEAKYFEASRKDKKYVQDQILSKSLTLK